MGNLWINPLSKGIDRVETCAIIHDVHSRSNRLITKIMSIKDKHYGTHGRRRTTPIHKNLIFKID